MGEIEASSNQKTASTSITAGTNKMFCSVQYGEIRQINDSLRPCQARAICFC